MEDQAPKETSGPSSEGMSPSSKRLVRILLIIGIGIPVLIEAATLIRLIGGHMSDETSASQMSSDTASVQVVNVGDELLPATPPAEVIAELIVEPDPAAGTWRFEMEVEIHNTTEYPYSLEVAELETQNGTRQRQQFSGKWASGEKDELEAEWALPEGQLPRSITARGRLHISADSMQEERRRVQFGKIPVQWRRK